MNFPIIISIKSISLSKQEKNFISKIKPFGVIIFARNISNIPQISKLNESIKLLSKNTLIFIDQEGGIVNRFKKFKEFNFLDSKWNKSFYGIYRERIWNGSLGESEIYSGYGSILQKVYTWIVDGVKKSEFLSLGLANITAEALNTKNLVTNLKGNLFYSLDQKFPISIVNPKKKSIDISYKYTPKPITKGLSLNTRLEASYSFYENGHHQEYLGLGVGPELTFGNFKNKTFDYTRISLLPFYKFDSGESVFKFDQNYEDLTLNISYDQQLYGPIILKSFGILNLTNDSNDYGEFIDSKISLNWKKRSYEVGIFYQPHNQAGGISFKLFGFK